MNWKVPVLALFALRYGLDFVLHLVRMKSAGNPTPENLRDVYDEQTYENWKKYSAEKGRLHMLSTLLSLLVTMLLLAFNVHARVAGLFSGNVYAGLLAVVIFQALADAVCAAGVNWRDTMVIEQKYGFNRATKKTFALDQVRSLLVDVLLSSVLTVLLCLIHRAMGDWVVVLFAGAVFLLSLGISFLYPYISRLGNKFVPLEDGELREKLEKLLTAHGYTVKDIQVMDASRRTTRLNAYFAGFGKTKTIVLYDNLLNAMSADEICAVFAHELGHGLHRDVMKMQLMNLGNLLIMAVIVWLCVRTPGMHEAFGFAGVNYGFAYILLGAYLALIQPLSSMGMNAYSRFAKYRADRQAVEEGYGRALCTALKILARENFAHLAPSPVLVKMEYSHPPMKERIGAIEKALQK